MNLWDLQFGWLVPLEFGTNIVVVTSSNPTTYLFVVIRDNQFEAEIWSPAFGTFDNGQAMGVEGYVSPWSANGELIGIELVTGGPNSVGVPVDGLWDGWFWGSVPADASGQARSLALRLYWTNGEVYVPRGLLEGYEITAKQANRVFFYPGYQQPTPACGSGWNIYRQRWDYLFNPAQYWPLGTTY
jgi:hypothetical protein